MAGNTSRENGKLGGRPKGSYSKPQISDYVTEAEVTELIEIAKTQAKDKPEILKFLLEQILGKARQSMELSGGVASIEIDDAKYDELIKMEYERLDH